MPVDLSNPRQQILLREVVFASVVALLVVLPALFSLGIAAWALVGSLLAFSFVHPRALLFAVPLTIPLSFHAVEVSDLEFNMLELLILAAAIGYAPRILSGAWQLRGIEAEQRHMLMLRLVPDRLAAGIAILLLIAGGLSLLFIADGSYAAESLRTFRWTILFPVAYFFLAAPIIVQRDEFRNLAAALLIGGGVIAALVAIVDGLLGGGVQADAVTRLSGMAPHPNALALVLDRVAVMGILIGILFRQQLDRLWLVPSILITIVVMLTFSRGAILGLAAGILIILILVRARRMAVAIAGASITGVVGMALVAPERTLSLLGGGSGSLRLELWDSSVQMIRDHPLAGVGPDQFLYQYLPRYVTPEAWPERFTSHPHNLVLDAWLSVGIIGVAVIILIVGLVFRNARVSLQARDRVALAAAGAIITAGVHGVVDQSYFLPELATSLWLLIILLIPPVVLDQDEAEPQPEIETEGQE